jgi:hypothetical protein
VNCCRNNLAVGATHLWRKFTRGDNRMAGAYSMCIPVGDHRSHEAIGRAPAEVLCDPLILGAEDRGVLFALPAMGQRNFRLNAPTLR